MKKQILIVSLSLLIILSSLLAACSADTLTPNTPSKKPSTTESDTVTTPDANYDAQIRDLENKIIELQQSQYVSDAEHQKELSALLDQLAALKAEAETQPTDTKKPTAESTKPDASRFLYTVADGKATITGYTGNETQLVIPSAIDGYPVHSIADSAFSSQTLKSVTISNGIVRIGWFAFRECPKLESVTVPASVTGIGYSAFPDASKTFTIYCHSNSFAYSYAQSYGYQYAVI